MAWYSYLRRETNSMVGSQAAAMHVGPAADGPVANDHQPTDDPLSGHPGRDASQATPAAAQAKPIVKTRADGEQPSQRGSVSDQPTASEKASGLPAEPKKPLGNPAHRPVAHRHAGGIALALGGGVAKGWAHIGVLRAVQEYDLPVTMIAGTSIGALVGGAYLSGVLDELEDFARSLTKSNVVRYLDFTLRGSGLISGARLARRMEEHMAETSIEDLDRPFVTVATDIRTGHEVWLSDGPIVPAIRASYALPGVFTPVMHGGRQLVDGALVNPVPVSVCRAFEPDMVIAVNLAATNFGKGTVIRPSHYQHIETAITEDDHSQAASWFSFIHARERSVQRENRLGVTSVMVEAFNIIQDRISRARLAGDPPDFTIRPRLANIGLIDFHKADEAIRLGYEEMTMRLRELEDQGILEKACGKRRQTAASDS